jgi:hypothetical protein
MIRMGGSGNSKDQEMDSESNGVVCKLVFRHVQVRMRVNTPVHRFNLPKLHCTKIKNFGNQKIPKSKCQTFNRAIIRTRLNSTAAKTTKATVIMLIIKCRAFVPQFKFIIS